MKMNTILPFLIPLVVVGALITYNEMNDNALLAMLNNNNNPQTQNITEKEYQGIEAEGNQQAEATLEETNIVTNEAIINVNADSTQNQNSEFITELIESQATTAQKSYNCGSKGCFETAFSNCNSAIGIDEILEPYSQKTQYKIIGIGNMGCKVKTTFEVSFFPDWEGKSITCELDNSLSITEAAGLIYQPNGSENLNCQGELLPELKKYGY